MRYRERGKGTFILDRRLGRLGRLKLASGTNDATEFDALDGMIVKLKKDRRWDLLELLRRHIVRPLDLYDAFHRGELDDLPTGDELTPLVPSVKKWLPGADVSVGTRNEYERALLRFLPEDARLGQLPDLIRGARTQAVQSGKRVSFNRNLMALRTYLRDTVGPRHRLFLAVSGIQQLEEHPRPGNPQEPEQIRALCGRMSKYADMIWALCLTGMRRGEYWGKWNALADRVTVNGTKTHAALRVVPLVYRPALPCVGYSAFYHALVEATGHQVIVHDLRKTAQRWWEDAGIPEWRIKLYAGHAIKKDLATIYRRPRELTRLLTEDADRIRTWLGDEPQPSLRVVSA